MSRRELEAQRKKYTLYGVSALFVTLLVVAISVSQSAGASPASHGVLGENTANTTEIVVEDTSSTNSTLETLEAQPSTLSAGTTEFIMDGTMMPELHSISISTNDDGDIVCYWQASYSDNYDVKITDQIGFEWLSKNTPNQSITYSNPIEGSTYFCHVQAFGGTTGMQSDPLTSAGFTFEKIEAED